MDADGRATSGPQRPQVSKRLRHLQLAKRERLPGHREIRGHRAGELWLGQHGTGRDSLAQRLGDVGGPGSGAGSHRPDSLARPTAGPCPAGVLDPSADTSAPWASSWAVIESISEFHDVSNFFTPSRSS